MRKSGAVLFHFIRPARMSSVCLANRHKTSKAYLCRTVCRLKPSIFNMRRIRSAPPNGRTILGTFRNKLSRSSEPRPKKKRILSDLKLDLSKFTKEPGDYDVPSHFYYINELDGFSISVHEMG